MALSEEYVRKIRERSGEARAESGKRAAQMAGELYGRAVDEDVDVALLVALVVDAAMADMYGLGLEEGAHGEVD